ncbi:MAG: DsrE family protein [Dysgonamonadaceae bacterium]|nr:DsrE family protein [Dysgonamonadaceae bacterium]
MKRLFLILVIFVEFLSAEGVVKKALFALTTSDVSTLESRLIKGVAFNAAHYQSVNAKLDMIVVIHGGAYKFFVKDISKTKCKSDPVFQAKAKEIHEKLAALAKTYNVTFYMCGVGMKAREIKKENILEFVRVAPSAMVALIDAQNDGYALVPID